MKTEFTSEDGYLHISTHLYRMRLAFAPKPVAQQQDSKGRWHECWPDVRIIPENYGVGISGQSASSHEAPLQLFVDSIPQEIREVVRPFASHQWLLLQLCGESDRIRDLAFANPVLAYVFVNNHEMRGTTAKVGHTLALMHAHQKQREMCQWLGFPATQAAVRLFKKIHPESASLSGLRLLRGALSVDSDELMGRLAHCKMINAGVLDFVTNSRLKALVTPALLKEIEQSEEEKQASALSEQLIHCIHNLVHYGLPLFDRPFRSISQIEQFIENADRECMAAQERENERQAALQEARAAEIAHRRGRNAPAEQWRREQRRRDEQTKANWPPAPLPGTDAIIPISSYGMLREEGRMQQNCISSYWRSVTGAQRNAYVYRMLEPERATFTIVKHSGNVWHLSQIKAKSNGRVKPATRAFVREWLYKHSLSTGLPF